MGEKEETFIQKAKAVHGDRYDYSRVHYSNSSGKVEIICPIHGVFSQIAHDHYHGKGCSKCNGGVRLTTERFIAKARLVHGSRYDYSRTEYHSRHRKLTIMCLVHGEFQQEAGSHLLGNGCPACAGRGELIDPLGEFRKTHGDLYEYPDIPIRWKDKIRIVCPVHGEFHQQAYIHKNGHGCKKCSHVLTGKKQLSRFDHFRKKAVGVHGTTYDYVESSFAGIKYPLTIVCPHHGPFTQIANNHISNRAGCPGCACIESRAERELRAFIKSLGVSIEVRTRKIIAPMEVDIWIPDKKIALEYCGLRWHGEAFAQKPRGYHLEKLERCEACGIRLITIFEDEWSDRKELVKKKLRHLMGLTEKGVGGREVQIHQASWKEVKPFLDENHLQGAGTPGFLNLVASHNGRTIAVMTFGKPRAALRSTGKSHIELLRFATDGRRNPGVAGRLLSFFLKQYPGTKLVSYADRRWSVGGLYESLGFELESKQKPGYWYFRNPNNQRFHRYTFRKSRVVELGGDPALSEWENMKRMGWDRIWDCGTLRYSLEG